MALIESHPVSAVATSTQARMARRIGMSRLVISSPSARARPGGLLRQILSQISEHGRPFQKSLLTDFPLFDRGLWIDMPVDHFGRKFSGAGCSFCARAKRGFHGQPDLDQAADGFGSAGHVGLRTP